MNVVIDVDRCVTIDRERVGHFTNEFTIVVCLLEFAVVVLVLFEYFYGSAVVYDIVVCC